MQESASLLPAPAGQEPARRNTTARPAQPTSQTTQLTVTQIKEELRKDAYEQLRRYGTKKEYVLNGVAVLSSSPAVGYKKSLNEEEREAAYGPKGLITNHIPKSAVKHDRSKDLEIKAKRPPKVCQVLYEVSRSVYCNVAYDTDAACQVAGVLVRFEHETSGTRGLLYYAKCNVSGGPLIEHKSHNLFPEEIAEMNRKSRSNPAQKKATSVSLSRQQEEALIEEFKERNPTREQVYNFVKAWKFKPDNELRTSSAQNDQVELLVQKCIEFIQNSKRSYKKGNGHRYFCEGKTDTNLTSVELLKVVEILSTPAGSPQRKRIYQASDPDSFTYLASSNFKICCERILITDHDCDGKTWSYFLVEYLHSSELGERSKQMHPDGRVQVSLSVRTRRSTFSVSYCFYFC